jgi:hypothetical protein
MLYTKLDLGIDMDSRIALVGPNGQLTSLSRLPLALPVPCFGSFASCLPVCLICALSRLLRALCVAVPVSFAPRTQERGNVGCRLIVFRFRDTGAGKSTLIKLMADELKPTEGAIRSHMHLMLGASSNTAMAPCCASRAAWLRPGPNPAFAVGFATIAFSAYPPCLQAHRLHPFFPPCVQAGTTSTARSSST